jgi:hypothetical protein
MELDFPVEKTVKTRSSVRTYEEGTLSAEEKNESIPIWALCQIPSQWMFHFAYWK